MSEYHWCRKFKNPAAAKATHSTQLASSLSRLFQHHSVELSYMEERKNFPSDRAITRSNAKNQIERCSDTFSCTMHGNDNTNTSIKINMNEDSIHENENTSKDDSSVKNNTSIHVTVSSRLTVSSCINSTSILSHASSSPTASAFLEKLYELLSDEAGNHSYIAWQPSGSSFLIKQPVEAFCNLVLPKYFKHNNLQSFVRQLNMYDFSKTSHDSNHREFTHELFRRGRRDLLPLIKRKVPVSHNRSNVVRGNVIESEDTSVPIYRTQSCPKSMVYSSSDTHSQADHIGIAIKEEETNSRYAHSKGRLAMSDVQELKNQVKELQLQVWTLDDQYQKLWSRHLELDKAFRAQNNQQQQPFPDVNQFQVKLENNESSLVRTNSLKKDQSTVDDLVRKVSMDNRNGSVANASAASFGGGALVRQSSFGSGAEFSSFSGLNYIATAATAMSNDVTTAASTGGEDGVATLYRTLSKSIEDSEGKEEKLNDDLSIPVKRLKTEP